MKNQNTQQSNTEHFYQRLDQTARFPYSLNEYIKRALWEIIQALLVRHSFRRAQKFRAFLFRWFGATLGQSVNLRSSITTFAPWQLSIGDYSAIGDNVKIYNLGSISIGSHTVISQNVHLCAGTHDYTQPDLPLIRSTITIGSGVWICADAFIGPGVTIGDNAIIGARAVVTKDVPANAIVAGNPARFLRERRPPEQRATIAPWVDDRHTSQQTDTRPLRVGEITLFLSRRGGGVAEYLWSIAKRLPRQGVSPQLIAIKDETLDQEHRSQYCDVPLLAADALGFKTLGYAHRARRQIKTVIRQADVVHLHGLRTLLNWQARKAATQFGKPIVISPHGQMDPWLLNQRAKLKWITNMLWVEKNIRTAALLHAVSPLEATHIRARCPKAPILIAAPGVDLASFDMSREQAREQVDRQWPQLKGKRIILYFGSLTERKGPHVLAQAWAKLHDSHTNWHAVFAGRGQAGDRLKIQRDLGSAFAQGNASFLGEVPRALKVPLLTAAELFVLPSFSEAFGIAVMESFAASRPVITTRATPWDNLQALGCGWTIDGGAEPLVDALNQAMALTDTDRARMGRCGREWVEPWCDWDCTIAKLTAAYRWLAGEGPKPDSVYFPDQSLPAAMLDSVQDHATGSYKTHGTSA